MGHRAMWLPAGQEAWKPAGGKHLHMFMCLCGGGGSVPATGMGLCISRAARMPRCQQDQRPVTGWTVPRPSYQRDPLYIYIYIFLTNRASSGSAREWDRMRPLVLV